MPTGGVTKSHITSTPHCLFPHCSKVCRHRRCVVCNASDYEGRPLDYCNLEHLEEQYYDMILSRIIYCIYIWRSEQNYKMDQLKLTRHGVTHGVRTVICKGYSLLISVRMVARYRMIAEKRMNDSCRCT